MKVLGKQASEIGPGHECDGIETVVVHHGAYRIQSGVDHDNGRKRKRGQIVQLVYTTTLRCAFRQSLPNGLYPHRQPSWPYFGHLLVIFHRLSFPLTDLKLPALGPEFHVVISS